jgi:CheY-like chemotaxis protein
LHVIGGDREGHTDGAGGAHRLTPAQRRLVAQLDECSRRVELLAALSHAGGVDRERAAHALAGELAELEAAATAAASDSGSGDGVLSGIGALTRATRQIVQQLGGAEVAHWRRRDVVVLDDNEVTRDLVTLALSAEGHAVRTCARLGELPALVRARKPHILLSEAPLPDAPVERLCSYLRRTIQIDSIPVIIFSSAQGDELARLARTAGADLYLSKDQGIGDLMVGISRLFEEILW